MPADPELVHYDNKQKNKAMKELRNKLTKAQAEKNNMMFKIVRIAKQSAINEIDYERRLESIQRQIVENDPDELGLQARKLKKMEKKHAKMDFMDKVTHKPDYTLRHLARVTNVLSSPDLVGDSESEFVETSSLNDSDRGQIDTKTGKSRAEKRLDRLLLQSLEDPFQRDVSMTEQLKLVHEHSDIVV